MVPGGEGAVALEAVTFFFVADAAAEVFFEGWEKVEGDVGGLESLVFFGIERVGDVLAEAAVGGGAWCGRGLGAAREGGGVASGEEAGCDGLGVAFYPA